MTFMFLKSIEKKNFEFRKLKPIEETIFKIGNMDKFKNKNEKHIKFDFLPSEIPA
jgi:hypothetical protein